MSGTRVPPTPQIHCAKLAKNDAYLLAISAHTQSTFLDISLIKSLIIMDRVGIEIGENLMVVLIKHRRVRDAALG